MRSVFLSYARNDLGAIEVLSGDLRGLGYQPWFDAELTGGIDWWHRILERIRQCDVFVFAASASSVDSKACLDEYGYAKALHRLVLPIVVADNVRVATLPVEVASLQLLDYRAADKKSLMLLARALLEMPAASPLPDPPPPLPRQPMSYFGELRELIDARGIDFDNQAGLLVKLRELWRDAKNRQEVLDLAIRFRRRRDIFLVVSQELDELLTSSGSTLQTAPRSQPTAEPPKSEPRLANMLKADSQNVRLPPKTPKPDESEPEPATASLVGIQNQEEPTATELLLYKNSTYKELRARYSDEQLMRALKISKARNYFQYASYRYDALGDAVNYAKLFQLNYLP